MSLPDPIPDRLIELLATRLRLIGDPTRIRLLDRLRRGPARVQDLAEATGTSQQSVSKHLTRLAENGFVVRERHGDGLRYRLIDPSPFEVLELISIDLERQIERLMHAVHDGSRSLPKT